MCFINIQQKIIIAMMSTSSQNRKCKNNFSSSSRPSSRGAVKRTCFCESAARTPRFGLIITPLASNPLPPTTAQSTLWVPYEYPLQSAGRQPASKPGTWLSRSPTQMHSAPLHKTPYISRATKLTDWPSRSHPLTTKRGHGEREREGASERASPARESAKTSHDSDGSGIFPLGLVGFSSLFS